MDDDDVDIENHELYIQGEIKALLADFPGLDREFDVVDRIGEEKRFHHGRMAGAVHCRAQTGTFSTVYKARSRANTNQHYALKRIYMVSAPGRIETEATFLFDHGIREGLVIAYTAPSGRHNVVRLLGGIRHKDQVLLVLEHFENHDFKEVLRRINERYIRRYMRCLFEALAYIHSCGMIHRDVKPTNFLFNLDTGEGRLVDFGLAQLAPAANATLSAAAPATDAYGLPVSSSARYGTNRYAEGSHTCLRTKASAESSKSWYSRFSRTRDSIEANRAVPSMGMWLGFMAAIDVWSAGVVLLTLLTGRYPFFLATDDLSALFEIRCLFGKDAMQAAGLGVERRLYESESCAPLANEPILRPNGTVDWRTLCETLNPEVVGRYPNSVYDLLGECLQLDPSRRITAKDAYLHPFLRPPLPL